MTMVDAGIYGAKRQTWKKNPRELLKQLIDKLGPDEEAVREKFAAKVQNDPDCIDPIIDYWFANNYRSIVHLNRPVDFGRQRAESQTVLTSAAVKAIKDRATQMVLLDMTILPNGKPLRDCTGKDCAKAGGWLGRIAAKIKPGDIVGAVLSEAEIKKLFK